jgi:hypothetical protein
MVMPGSSWLMSLTERQVNAGIRHPTPHVVSASLMSSQHAPLMGE